MAWLIYDYVHPVHGNLVQIWRAGLQTKERAKLDAKVDALRLHGPALIPGILSPTGVPSVFKLKVQGQVKLRPLLCEGPSDTESYTLLIGAKEVQFEYEPHNALELAVEYRADLIANPRRRELHERPNRKTQK